MFGIFHAITRKVSTKTLNAPAAMFVLALLPGCAAVNTATTEPPTAVSNACNAETDTFCVESDQDNGIKLNSEGLEYAAKKDYDQAMERFKRAIELDNSNPEFHYNLAVTYSYKGMDEEEESAYMDVLAIEPDDPKLNPVLASTYFNLACMYALQGKKDQAFEQLEKLYSVDSRTLYHYVQSDEDLKSLRDDPRFKELMAKRSGNTGQLEEASQTGETGQTGETSQPEASVK